ncbi:MAG: hypothetical protein GTO40_00130 [Deltaproteobacteria bacterium]|nr:hypothetical protein [Deltaproteobacteria bacterium]
MLTLKGSMGYAPSGTIALDRSDTVKGAHQYLVTSGRGGVYRLTAAVG